MVALFIFALLGLAALTIDTGRGWTMRRELQRTADAAALAAAQYLPQDEAGAVAAANQYIAKNPLRDGTISSSKITFSCVAPNVNCSPHNAVKVELKASVGTTFGKVVSIDTMNGGARSVAVATQPKKYDIEIVLDRTGSMGDSSKITYAKQAIQSFLTQFDPTGTWIGLTVFPPAPAANANACASFNYTTTYNDKNASWVTVPLSSDYVSGGVLNSSSNLVKQVACVTANGTTAYETAIQKGQAALAAQGRADAQDIIIFLTDGAANTAPSYLTATEKAQPCHSAMSAATSAKSAGVRIFAIAYNVTDPGCLNSSGAAESPSITPEVALKAIASPTDYYFQPDAGALAAIFKDIAGELNGTKTRLQDDGSF